MLGLKLTTKDSSLCFSRGNKLPVESIKLTRRELFSACKLLVGHCPIAGWLRVDCSYIKKVEGSKWDNQVGEVAVNMVNKMIAKVKDEDPVKGYWHVPWCDASSIAIGTVLEVDEKVVEDASWLRKKYDFSHINVAELEFIPKGVNLPLKWGLQELEVKTDSVTVCGWIETIIKEEKGVRTKGAA